MKGFWKLSLKVVVDCVIIARCPTCVYFLQQINFAIRNGQNYCCNPPFQSKGNNFLVLLLRIRICIVDPYYKSE